MSEVEVIDRVIVLLLEVKQILLQSQATTDVIRMMLVTQIDRAVGGLSVLKTHLQTLTNGARRKAITRGVMRAIVLLKLIQDC